MRDLKEFFLHLLFNACVIFESFSEAKDIRLPALGRRAEFFEVYNLVDDEFTRVVAIPMQNQKKYKVKTVPVYQRDYMLSVAGSMTEYISSWKFETSVKAGTILSIFKGEIRTEIGQHWENAKMSLVLIASIRATTIREEVDPCDRQIYHRPPHPSDRYNKVFAAARIVGDHVLIAKEYGFEVDIFVKLTARSSGEGIGIAANLEMAMEHLIKKITFEFEADAHSGIHMAKIEKEAVITVSVNTRYATFPFAVPEDYNDVPKFIKDVSAYLNDQKNLNGSVVEYILKPAQEIEKCTKVGTVILKNSTGLDRIAERMFTFFLEIDRQETENYRFRSRFDLVKECMSATEYAIVVREIMDARMILMDLRIQVIEAIETYRRGEYSYDKVINVLTTLTRETLSKKFSVKQFIPDELLHKINFMFALASDREIYCFPRHMNPTLHFNSYIQDMVTLAFVVFRSTDFSSGELGVEQYIKTLKIIDRHQSPLNEDELEFSNKTIGNHGPGCINNIESNEEIKICKVKSKYVKINEQTLSVEEIQFKPIRGRKKFVALNCDNDFDVCDLMLNFGLYHGWTYEGIDEEMNWDFMIMNADNFFYNADREFHAQKPVQVGREGLVIEYDSPFFKNKS